MENNQEQLQKQLEQLQMEVRKLTTEKHRSRKELEQLQLERMQLKAELIAAADITAEELAQTEDACATCMASELTLYYDPVYERDAAGEYTGEVLSVQTRKEWICGKQHGRPLLMLVAGCTMHEPEPGLKQFQELQQRQSEQAQQSSTPEHG